MPTAAQVLGKFGAELKYSDLPPAVVEHAKDCIIDTMTAMIFGAQLPWSRIVADYARRYGSGGPCSIVGSPGMRVHTPYAALANGVFAHAFEQDNGRQPSVGAHPGATLMPAIIAACQETNADGKAAVTAFVAGCEVLFRIGAATHYNHQTPEKLGFHAPGTIGSYGAAVAAGSVFGLSDDELANALGIAGSLSSGILAFTKSKQGGMVKRLHIGRAAESGILAARLASSGYTGPETILEGKFGLLEVYCPESNAALLTADLHKDWETLRIKMKPYSSQGNTHTPIQSTRGLMAEYGFKGADVASVLVEGSERLVSHHIITEPGDIMQAQYSVPFCVALALFRDPEDPNSFLDGALEDREIRNACRSLITVRLFESRSQIHSRVTVRLKDGREFVREAETARGMQPNLFSRADLRRRLMFAAGANETAAAGLFERLENLEAQASFPVM
jgi:2-methylcitrate dehydratase PrpD